MYKGSCHCGAIRFTVDGELEGVMACSCSICQRKGALMWFVSREQLNLLNGADTMASYTFNKHVIKHHFCPTCGMHPFGIGTDPRGNSMAAININCLEEIDLASVPVQHYNGRAS